MHLSEKYSGSRLTLCEVAVLCFTSVNDPSPALQRVRHQDVPSASPDTQPEAVVTTLILACNLSQLVWQEVQVLKAVARVNAANNPLSESMNLIKHLSMLTL